MNTLPEDHPVRVDERLADSESDDVFFARVRSLPDRRDMLAVMSRIDTLGQREDWRAIDRILAAAPVEDWPVMAGLALLTATSPAAPFLVERDGYRRRFRLRYVAVRGEDAARQVIDRIR